LKDGIRHTEAGNHMFRRTTGFAILTILVFGFVSWMVGRYDEYNSRPDTSPLLLKYVNLIPDLSIPYHGRIMEDRPTLWHHEELSSGTAIYTKSPNAEIRLRFEGAAIRIVGYTGDYNGYAEIWLDDELVEVVDTFSPNLEFHQAWFSSPSLAEGPHTLLVKAQPTKPPSSQGHNIGIDYIEVIQSDGSIRKLEASDPQIEYIHANSYEYLQFISRKAGHFIFYFLLTLYGIAGIRYITLRWKWSYWCILPMMMITLLEEAVESILLGTPFGWFDVLVDSAGICTVFLLLLLAAFLKYSLLPTNNTPNNKSGAD
jgi:hypothetical protein